jgi:hypothetical protein
MRIGMELRWTESICLPMDNRILSVNVALLELLKSAEIRALFPLFIDFSRDEKFCIYIYIPKVLKKNEFRTYLVVDDRTRRA